MQHFRGVVWPRQNNKKVTTIAPYRYVVIGMVVSDVPLENLEGQNEIVLDGMDAGLSEALQTIKQAGPPAFTLGDANMVLTNLEYLVRKDDE